MSALTTSGRLRRQARSERGAEIIELAIVTPIFAMLIAAMFDFGFLFRNWEVVTNAAREGARMGVLSDYACDDTTDDIKDRVTSYMRGSGITDDNSYSVDLDTQQVDTGSGTFTACIVTVELTQPLPSLSVIAAAFGGAFGDVPVRSSAVMRTEAQAAP